MPRKSTRTPEQKKAAHKISAAKWAQTHREACRAASKKWRTLHPEKHYRTPEKALLAGAKFRAKEKGLPFNLVLSDIVIPEFCPVLDIRLAHCREGHLDDNSPTLDRFIPELGYVSGNVCVISAKANKMKSNATPDEIQKLLDWILSKKTLSA